MVGWHQCSYDPDGESRCGEVSTCLLILHDLNTRPFNIFSLVELSIICFREHYVYTCRKRIGGGMATRPFRCVTVPDVVKDTNSLIRSSSDEENEATIVKMAPTPKVENLKISKVESRQTALTQVQVPVLNH